MRLWALGSAKDFRFWILFPTYDILHTTYCSKNCNIFTLVGSEKCTVMSDELKILIELLTRWILMAFSSFVPKITGCRMGTGQLGDKGRAFPSRFSSNFRKILTFFPLPTAYCLLPTASSIPLLFRGHSLSKLGHPLSKQGQPLSKPGQALSKSGHPLSPQTLFALYLGANRSYF